MSDEPRWSLAELRIRYELEPDLQDVFVEGTFDQEALTQANAVTFSDRSFYPIGVVDVPASVLHKYGLTKGNKQRVMSLAFELEAMSVDAEVACLVDRDLDHWFGSLHAARHLRWTMFSCLEGHFLTQQAIADVLVVAGRAKIRNISAFVESVESTLVELYSLRLADRELGTSLRWLPISKHLSRKDDAVRLDRVKYVTSVLSTNGGAPKRATFLNAADAWRAKIAGDVRLAFRGHDYTDILAWAMREYSGKKEFSTPEAVERIFVLLARSSDTLGRELVAPGYTMSRT